LVVVREVLEFLVVVGQFEEGVGSFISSHEADRQVVEVEVPKEVSRGAV
jgi:hypothetical protein